MISRPYNFQVKLANRYIFLKYFTANNINIPPIRKQEQQQQQNTTKFNSLLSHGKREQKKKKKRKRKELRWVSSLSSPLLNAPRPCLLHFCALVPILARSNSEKRIKSSRKRLLCVPQNHHDFYYFASSHPVQGSQITLRTPIGLFELPLSTKCI